MTANITPAAASLLITAMLCLAALRAWAGWLELKRLEIASRRIDDEAGGTDGAARMRIELASVKERLKKLEAIASGVEL